MHFSPFSLRLSFALQCCSAGTIRKCITHTHPPTHTHTHIHTHTHTHMLSTKAKLTHQNTLSRSSPPPFSSSPFPPFPALRRRIQKAHDLPPPRPALAQSARGCEWRRPFPLHCLSLFPLRLWLFPPFFVSSRMGVGSGGRRRVSAARERRLTRPRWAGKAARRRQRPSRSKSDIYRQFANVMVGDRYWVSAGVENNVGVLSAKN